MSPVWWLLRCSKTSLGLEDRSFHRSDLKWRPSFSDSTDPAASLGLVSVRQTCEGLAMRNDSLRQQTRGADATAACGGKASAQATGSCSPGGLAEPIAKE